MVTLVDEEYNKHPGNTTEASGVAAEAAEWCCCKGNTVPNTCFPIQDSVCSLSSEDQALKLLGSSCSCTFLFGTQSSPMLPHLEDQVLNVPLRYFLIRDSVYSLFTRGPSTKFLTLWEDSLLEHISYLLP